MYDKRRDEGVGGDYAPSGLIGLVAALVAWALPAPERLLELGRRRRVAVLEGILKDERAPSLPLGLVDQRLGRAFAVLHDELSEAGEIGRAKHPQGAEPARGGGESVVGQRHQGGKPRRARIMARMGEASVARGGHRYLAGVPRGRSRRRGQCGRAQDKRRESRQAHAAQAAPAASLFTRWAKLFRSFFSLGGMIARQ